MPDALPGLAELGRLALEGVVVLELRPGRHDLPDGALLQDLDRSRVVSSASITPGGAPGWRRPRSWSMPGRLP